MEVQALINSAWDAIEGKFDPSNLAILVVFVIGQVERYSKYHLLEGREKEELALEIINGILQRAEVDPAQAQLLLDVARQVIRQMIAIDYGRLWKHAKKYCNSCLG